MFFLFNIFLCYTSINTVFSISIFYIIVYCMLSVLIAYKSNNADHQYDFRMLRDTNNQEASPKMMTQYVNVKGHTAPQALCLC